MKIDNILIIKHHWFWRRKALDHTKWLISSKAETQTECMHSSSEFPGVAGPQLSELSTLPHELCTSKKLALRQETEVKGSHSDVAWGHLHQARCLPLIFLEHKNKKTNNSNNNKNPKPLSLQKVPKYVGCVQQGGPTFCGWAAFLVGKYLQNILCWERWG